LSDRFKVVGIFFSHYQLFEEYYLYLGSSE
jgi:hypothetical protein